MSPDDYDDFISWKKGLSSIYSTTYLDRYGLNTGDYNRWKHNNEISGYDEKMLIKLYALERQLERLEAVVYKALED